MELSGETSSHCECTLVRAYPILQRVCCNMKGSSLRIPSPLGRDVRGNFEWHPIVVCFSAFCIYQCLLESIEGDALHVILATTEPGLLFANSFSTSMHPDARTKGDFEMSSTACSTPKNVAAYSLAPSYLVHKHCCKSSALQVSSGCVRRAGGRNLVTLVVTQQNPLATNAGHVVIHLVLA